MRSHGARTPEEKESFSYVLSEYFIETEQGFIHEKCDKVLAEIYEKSEKATKAAKIRWAKHNKKKAELCKEDADAFNIDANAPKTDADGMLPITHNPIPKNNKPSLSDKSDKHTNADLNFVKRMVATFKTTNPKYKEPNLQSWEETIRLMRERDNRTLEEMAQVFKWANQDSFWSSNIMSPRKLREQFDVLTAKMNQKGTTNGNQIRTNHQQSTDELEKWARDRCQQEEPAFEGIITGRESGNGMEVYE